MQQNGDSGKTGTSRKVIHTPASAPYDAGGRRSFFAYKDFGLEEVTNGMMRAQVSTTTTGLTKSTGWHYHICDVQFNYILKGWADLEFEDGRQIRVEAGDALVIPGGVRHNELRTSNDLEALEVSVPFAMGTVPCDPPE